MADPARRSELESRRFGVSVWRADVASESEARTLAGFLRAAAVDLVIARVPVDEHAAIAFLESSGFFLCDTLVRWRAAVEPFRGAKIEGARDAVAADAGAIRAIALESFRDYPSHYHADPRLDRALIAEGYAEWAANGKNTIVIEERGRIVGFLTWELAAPSRGEIVLNAVASDGRGRGHYSSLVRAAGARIAAAGGSEVVVGTQLANIAPQRVWARAGFVPYESLHTFHRWAR